MINMSKLPRAMKVCQNCLYSDNKKGKWFQDGWNIYCNNECRWFRWDTRKRCFVWYGGYRDKENDDNEKETQT